MDFKKHKWYYQKETSDYLESWMYVLEYSEYKGWPQVKWIIFIYDHPFLSVTDEYVVDATAAKEGKKPITNEQALKLIAMIFQAKAIDNDAL